MMQCLIIDDDVDDREIFLMCMNEVNKDIICTTCTDAVDAIAMLDSNPAYIPKYIFIDVNMPKLNGILCLGVLKKMDRLRDSKMYMYSTTADPSAIDISKELGADDFIVKPVKITDLKATLTAIFAQL